MKEEKSESKVKDVIDAVTGLVNSVPVYHDAIQPATKEVGKSLETVVKTVNVALSPLKALVWSFEKLQSFIDTKVSEKLKLTPEAEIQTPKSNIVVPALQALSYSGDEPILQELFANLIAASMDQHTSNFAHPSFVEIIKQLTPDEAKILRRFSQGGNLPIISLRSELKEGIGGWDIHRNVSLFAEEAFCDNLFSTSVYLDNFIRLGLINIPKDFAYINKEIYNELINQPDVQQAIKNIDEEEGRKHQIVHGLVNITDFGNQFISVCVIDHIEHRK